MRVPDRLSEEFGVGIGLRQGCDLSSLLLSLYINGVVTRLHDKKCGVRCGGNMVPGLHDSSWIASDKEELKKSLDVLVQWCEEWGVNVDNSGIMHMRKKMVVRCEVEHKVDGEVIPMLFRLCD